MVAAKNIIPILAFKDNYIWCLLDKETRYAVIVDPGDAELVLNYLQQHQLELTAILITHHHADHCGGVARLLSHYPVPVYGPAHESIPFISNPVAEPDQIKLATHGVSLTVLDLPGHTKGHIAYYGDGNLFCGDVLFGAGCGRVFEGTMEQMYESLQKISALPLTTKIYCAHEYTEVNLRFAQRVEPQNQAIQARIEQVRQLLQINRPSLPSRLSTEKLTNPFLRCHIPAIIAAASHYKNQKLVNESEVFTAIREWRNDFKA